MLLSILNDKTFMVGSKTYKVGEKLNLAEMKTRVIFPWGETSIVDLNEHLTAVSDLLRTTRKKLSARLHEVDDDFDEVAARLSIDYEAFERDWLFYSDVFYKAIQRNIGGNLPLVRDPGTGEITIRTKQPQETLNYLRDVCTQRVRFHNYESIRHLALHLAGSVKDQVAIESELHIDTQVPIVSANSAGEQSTLKDKSLIDWLEDAVIATYDKVTKYGPVAGIVWAHDKHYFLNAGALLRAGQGDPKLALTTAIQRCVGKLPKPSAIGFFIYGNMPIVDEKARGVLLSTLLSEKEPIKEGESRANYKILTVSDSQKLRIATEGDDITELTVAKEGQESKLDEAIINIAKEAMKEEKPKEE